MASQGFRGSSSDDASAYKKAGHANEEVFGSLVGGTNKGLHPQGKTDWKSETGENFSVKRGLSPVSRKWTKHWQVFLYGLNRLKSDAGFANLGRIGQLLTKSLESFPESQQRYEADKSKVKRALVEIPKNIKGVARVNLLRQLVGEQNEYVNSKDRLARVNEHLVNEFADKFKLQAFLRKALFNGTEVDFLAIQNGSGFDIFPRELVVAILSEKLHPQLSTAGARFDDLNIPGQKVIMKCQTNIVEIEVRNEENHYRELRFNMSAQKAHNLLVSNSRINKSIGLTRWFG